MSKKDNIYLFDSKNMTKKDVTFTYLFSIQYEEEKNEKYKENGFRNYPFFIFLHIKAMNNFFVV